MELLLSSQVKYKHLLLGLVYKDKLLTFVWRAELWILILIDAVKLETEASWFLCICVLALWSLLAGTLAHSQAAWGLAA